METIQQKANEFIKEATKTNHQQLEKKVVLMLKEMTDKQGYFNLLNVFYNYFSALEAKIDAFIDTDTLPDYAQRRKSAAIKNDIETLGFKVIPNDAVETPEISNTLEALAALYVMEGSTLGGGIIVKMLQQKGINEGISFFTGYGDETFPMWNKFVNTLNTVAETEADIERMIATTQSTFDCFQSSF